MHSVYSILQQYENIYLNKYARKKVIIFNACFFPEKFSKNSILGGSEFFSLKIRKHHTKIIDKKKVVKLQ